MTTDIHKLNLDDLLGRLFYATVNKEWSEIDAIRAEVARRIEVRDIIVASLLDVQAQVHQVCGPRTKGHILSVSQGDDYTHPPTYHLNGEQIL